jgi:hypothetical protein
MPSAESEQCQGLAASDAHAPALLGRRNDTIQERTIMTDTTLGASYQAPEATVPNPPLGSPNAEPSVAQPQASSTPAGDAKQAAAGVAGQVKQRLTSAATDRKAGIADRLDEVAESLNKSSEQFAGKQDWIAGAIARGGTELGTLANSLRETDPGDLLRQVQSFAQRQPGLFIGASLVAGFAVARFGKIVAADVSSDDLPVMPEVGHGQH